MTSRAWCFTLNNPTEDEKNALSNCLPDERYCVYQLEKGDSGTPHMQGYCYFEQRKSLRQVKTYIGQRAHCEPAKGSPSQNRTYCTKDEGRLDGPFERGQIPSQGRRTDLSEAAALAREGKLGDISDETWVRYHRGLTAVHHRTLQPRDPDEPPPEVLWFWGATGTGKSRAAHDKSKEFNSVYWVSNGKWWCDYQQQEVVVIDDFRPDLLPFHRLLRVLDRYPYKVEWKGGGVWVNSKLFIVTAPHPPDYMFQEKTEEAIGQLTRRITEVREFK